MDHRRTSRFLSRPAAVVVGALAFAVAACGGAAPVTQADAYTIATKSFDASWDQVKVQVGLTTTGAKEDISIKPEAIQFAVDSKAGKGALHLALPTDVLGDEAASLAKLGVTGDTLDVDVVYDGQALYAKSPVAATLLPMLLAQSGQTLTGDLSGWLKLGTAADFAALAGSLGGALPIPSPSAAASNDLSVLDAAALKAKLESAGVVLTVVGSEQRNGVDADHLTITVDPVKFAASDFAKQLPADRLTSITDAAGKGSLSADLWLDKASGRVAELDLHAADEVGAKAEITLLVSTPDGNAFSPPATSTEVPLAPMLTQMLPLLGAGLMN